MRRAALVIVVAAMLGGAVAYAATMDTTADDLTAFSSATTVDTIATTTTVAPSSTTMYLKTSGSGAVAWTDTLPLSTTAPTATSLANYDTDRDSVAGLTIAKGGNNQNVGAGPTRQRWTRTGAAYTLNGAAQLKLWAQMEDSLNATNGGQVLVFLMRCDSASQAASGCTMVGSGEANHDPWGGGSTFSEKTISLGTLSNVTVTAAQHLVVQISVHNSSDDHMWFAYDTTTYTSRLIVQ